MIVSHIYVVKCDVLMHVYIVQCLHQSKYVYLLRQLLLFMVKVFKILSSGFCLCSVLTLSIVTLLCNSIPEYLVFI
jgi:hypothetical protein